MALLQIYLLGQFSVLLDSDPVTRFRSNKSRLLLAYLAGQPDVVHQRSVLAATFWGGQTERAALTSLRVALSGLKGLLKAHPALEISRAQVIFHGAQASVDVTQFQEGIGSDSAENKLNALELYRGEFLPGIHTDDASELDDWRLLMQERLHQMAMRALDDLQAHFSSQNEWALLAKSARQQLEHVPWHEPAHRALIEALAKSGDLQAAEQQLELCRTVLLKEVGADISEVTAALWQRVNIKEVPNNLPQALPPFFGRTEEVAQIEAVLSEKKYRLLTLTGIGGTGKTRLSHELARRQVEAATFTDGVWFVPLASVESAEAVAPAIAAVLGIVLDSAETTPLHNALKDKNLLLILDNLEQLPDGATDVIHDLLQSTRHLTILATSRRRLGLRIENLFPLSGLPNSPALTLFTEQFSRINRFAERPDKAIAGEICQLLDGLPLGIELAVAQAEQLPLGDVLLSLEKSLSNLSTTMRDVPLRQRSLRAVFESSWVLLSSAQQTLLSQMAVFEGSTAQSDILAIVTGATPKRLQQLVAHSLLRFDGEDRFDMHPLVREFSAEKRAESDQTPDNHSRYFLGSISSRAGHSQRKQGFDNVRAAWRWAVAKPDLMQLRSHANNFKAFILSMGYLVEGDRLIEQGVQVASSHGDRETEARLMYNQADLTRRWDSQEKGFALMHAALALNPSDAVQGDLHGSLASEYAELGKMDTSYQHHETHVRLARKTEDPAMIVEALEAYAYTRVLYFAGDYEVEIARLEEALALAQEYQLNAQHAATLRSLCTAYARYGDYAKAMRMTEEVLQQSRTLEDKMAIEANYLSLGLCAFFAGYHQMAVDHFKAALTVDEEMNDVEGIGLLNANLCLAYRCMGRLAQALSHGLRGAEILKQLGALRMEGQARNRLAHTYLAQGRFEEAATAYEVAMAVWSTQDNPNQYEAFAGYAASLAQLGRLSEAQKHAEDVIDFAFADNLHKVVEPYLMLQNCGIVMRALGEDDRERALVQLANEWAATIASRISDDEMRAHYLQSTGL